MTPAVRATFGSFSGPITSSAMTAMTSSSEKAMSNIRSVGGACAGAGARSAPVQKRTPGVPGILVGASTRAVPASGFGARLLLDLAFDGLAGHLRRRTAAVRRALRRAALDAVLEALHRVAEVRPDVAQLLRAEDEHDDEQHDQPVPDAERSHGDFLAYCRTIIGPRGLGPPIK